MAAALRQHVVPAISRRLLATTPAAAFTGGAATKIQDIMNRATTTGKKWNIRSYGTQQSTPQLKSEIRKANVSVNLLVGTICVTSVGMMLYGPRIREHNIRQVRLEVDKLLDQHRFNLGRARLEIDKLLDDQHKCNLPRARVEIDKLLDDLAADLER